MYVVEKIELEVPVVVAWNWLSNLERLVTANLFHQATRFEGEQRQGVGTKVWLEHGLKFGPTLPCLARVTHWEEQKRLGWVEIDPAHPKGLFPHSQQFRLEVMGETHTLLIDELRGSLNLNVGGRLLDNAFAKYWVGWVLRQECHYLKKEIEKLL